AAAIPVLIHLLNLRRLRTIEFSSLQFLKELQKTSLRRLRIQQILLLVLRTLLIVLLVLAFSRPALHGSLAGVIGSRASSTIVILLDDSPSMRIRNTRGSLFAQAQDAAREILRSADIDDAVFLVSLSSLRKEDSVPDPASSIESAMNSISSMEVSQISVPIREGLQSVQEVFEVSPHPNNELYIVSDGQKTQVPFGTTSTDTIEALGRTVRCFFITVPPSDRNNLGAGPIDVQTWILVKNRPVYLESAVRNPSDKAVQNLIVSIYLDGSRVAQQSVEIPPQGTATIPFTIVPKRRGILTAYVKLEDDILEIDNSFFFTLAVPEVIRILLVGGSDSDTRFPYSALTLAGDTMAAGLFRVERRTEDRLPFLDLAAYDALVLCGVTDFSPTEAEQVGTYVRSGGGLVVFPGAGSDLANYNESLFRALAIPRAVQSTGQTERGRDPSTPPTSFLAFSLIDFSHPVFKGMFEQADGFRNSTPSVESPTIATSFSPAPGPTGHSIIGLSDGKSFLTEFRPDNGRVFVFAVDAGLAWSDFALKGIFAPLLHRSMMYLAVADEKHDQFEVGKRIDVTTRFRSKESSNTFFLLSPSGREERVVPESGSPSGMVRIISLPTTETGIHTLVRRNPGHGSDNRQDEIIGALPVNVRQEESDLRPLSREESAELWGYLGVNPDHAQLLEPGDRVMDVVQESRFGVELWQYLIALALLLALIEMAVARGLKPGDQQMAES
ncbi:MAG: BatA domain-containing protein, partial [Bacteroidetes bacterium]|nr:BatA domain-containing protein [Bacteroidota bacterium]